MDYLVPRPLSKSGSVWTKLLDQDAAPLVRLVSQLGRLSTVYGAVDTAAVTAGAGGLPIVKTTIPVVVLWANRAARLVSVNATSVHGLPSRIPDNYQDQPGSVVALNGKSLQIREISPEAFNASIAVTAGDVPVTVGEPLMAGDTVVMVGDVPVVVSNGPVTVGELSDVPVTVTDNYQDARIPVLDGAVPVFPSQGRSPDSPEAVWVLKVPTGSTVWRMHSSRGQLLLGVDFDMREDGVALYEDPAGLFPHGVMLVWMEIPMESVWHFTRQQGGAPPDSQEMAAWQQGGGTVEQWRRAMLQACGCGFLRHDARVLSSAPCGAGRRYVTDAGVLAVTLPHAEVPVGATIPAFTNPAVSILIHGGTDAPYGWWRYVEWPQGGLPLKLLGGPDTVVTAERVTLEWVREGLVIPVLFDDARQDLYREHCAEFHIAEDLQTYWGVPENGSVEVPAIDFFFESLLQDNLIVVTVQTAAPLTRRAHESLVQFHQEHRPSWTTSILLT